MMMESSKDRLREETDEPAYYENRAFKDIAGAGSETADREYEKCTFIHCNFSGAVFRSCVFTDCGFTDCNLALVKLVQCQLNDAGFKNCKLTGVNFTECTVMPFSVSFDGCILDYSSFANMKMPRTPFANSSLKGVDFSGADLSRSVFGHSDLSGAVFSRTSLKEADFTSAVNFIIDPENNMIRKAKFSLYGAYGLLSKYGITIKP